MPVLIGGFTLQTGVPIDDRYVIASSSNRFDFSAGLLYEGATTYAEGDQQYFIFVSSSAYDTADEDSAWREIILSDPGGTGSITIGSITIEEDASIGGVLTLAGVGNVSESIAETVQQAGNLQTVTDRGAITTNVITASNGIVSPMIIAAEAEATQNNSFFAVSGSGMVFEDQVNKDSFPAVKLGGLMVSGGILYVGCSS